MSRDTSSEYYKTGVCGKCHRATTEGLEFAGEMRRPTGEPVYSVHFLTLCPVCRGSFKNWCAEEPGEESP